jgi:hypothetical protein
MGEMIYPGGITVNRSEEDFNRQRKRRKNGNWVFKLPDRAYI